MKRIRIAGIVSGALCVPLILARCGGDGTTDPGTQPSHEFPLAVGNQWIYEVTTQAGKTSVEIDTTTIVGTVTEGGNTWYIFVDHAEADSSFIRQDGNVVYINPPRPEFDSQNAMTNYLMRVLEDSRPWKFGDFGAAAGASWILVEAETTFVTMIGGQPYETSLNLSFWASSEGLTNVTAQSGTYSDVYKGEIHQLIVFTNPAGSDSMKSDMTFWAADGVGLIRTEETGVDTFDGTIETTSEDLIAYSLQ